MKKIIIGLCFILSCTFLLVGCKNSNEENETGIEKVQVDSEIYTQDDIESAMDLVLENFEENYIGATITKITYVGDERKSDFDIYKETYEVDEVIILYSDLYTESTIGDIPFDVNSEYEDYPWVLARKADEDWEIRSWGY